MIIYIPSILNALTYIKKWCYFCPIRVLVARAYWI